MQPTAAYWIEHLQLQPHPEGGWYKRTYCSDIIIERNNLPNLYNGNRSLATAIYYLLEIGHFSVLHRIAADELWHFYAGDPLEIITIKTDESLALQILGNHPEKGESLQYLVKGGNWFGARLTKESKYALVGCTVSPGFDFAEFEIGRKDELVKQYPQYSNIIQQLTK